jgi:hypothetical protein
MASLTIPRLRSPDKGLPNYQGSLHSEQTNFLRYKIYAKVFNRNGVYILSVVFG